MLRLIFGKHTLRTVFLTMKVNSLKAVDFFCGAGGMSYGLHRAGISVLGGLDIETDCRKTYEENVPEARFVQRDITQLSEISLARFFKIKRNDDALVFCGCSPCQFWSKVRTDKTSSRKTAYLLQHFERFIRHFRPGFIIIENVPGLLTKKKHSILPHFLEFLTNEGYSYRDGIIDAVLYGVPQHRHRYLLVATRLNKKVTLPRKRTNTSLTVRRFIKSMARLVHGKTDKRDSLHRAAALSDTNLRRIKRTPKNGGDRSSWQKTKRLQLNAYKGRDDIFKDVYGRMFWHRPAPTITTRFNSLSNGRFGHPRQNRAISLREGALLQTFPKSFEFYGNNQSSLARQIGNAVPPALAFRIGKHLKRSAGRG